MKLIEENKEKSVITTRFVLENKSSIISVFYDEDGDWQFLGKEEVTEADAMVVSIEQILELDTTLCTLPDISKGQSIFRNDKNSSWQIRN